MTKEPTSFRLSPGALQLLKELSERFGISQAAVVEMAVRKLGRQEVGTQQIEKESREMQIQDAETKIKNKDNEELGLFIEELLDQEAERWLSEVDEELLKIALDERDKR